MSKKLEKEDWSQLSDEEKRNLDQQLEEEQKGPKETGWEEKFKERQRLIKDPIEEIRPGEPAAEKPEESETKLTEQREELDKVYESKTQQAPEENGEEAERMIKEAESELKRLIDEKKQLKKELSELEIYRLTKKFYLDKLDYEVKLKGILGKRARIWDKKTESYILDDQTKKPIEFKLMRSPKGETPLIKFLREIFEASIKNILLKEGLDKDKTGKIGEKEDLREGAIRDLAEAWQGQEEEEKEKVKIREEIEKEAEMLMQEKREELYGKSISDPEVYYNVTRNFYFKKFGYKPKLKGLLGGKARIWDLKAGEYVKDKDGKPLEFKTEASPRGETPLLKFLEEKYKNEFIIKDLEKKYREKAEIVNEEFPEETDENQEEEQKVSSEPHIIEETREEADSPKQQAPDVTEENLTAENSKEIKVHPSTIKKLKEFFEGFSIEPDEDKRKGRDRQIQKVLDALENGEIDLAESEISRMLENSRRNMETAKNNKDQRAVKRNESNIKKLEGFIGEIKYPIEDNETEITAEELTRIFENAIQRIQENNGEEDGSEEKPINEDLKFFSEKKPMTKRHEEMRKKRKKTGNQGKVYSKASRKK